MLTNNKIYAYNRNNYCLNKKCYVTLYFELSVVEPLVENRCLISSSDFPFVSGTNKMVNTVPKRQMAEKIK